MATLVLTAVGGIVGGPVGAAIGAIVGQQIDRNILFKPKGREGPRLNDLAVQTSRYGSAIPRLYGTMRVAGTVIWSTDLIEQRSRSGGKGRPTTTTYSYSVSFAVLLSARPVRAVKRIWADGKLLRGAAGDFKSGLGGFRLHGGAADQAADPLIVSAEGIGLAPACRGMAYAVFEQLQLEDFGNRIPSLTFEVEADAGPVAIGAILADASGGLVLADEGEAAVMLGGYSAYGSSVAGIAEGLAELGGGWFAPGEAGVELRAGPGVASAIADQGMRPAGSDGDGSGRSIAAADRAPGTLTLAYYDPARDFQTGLQRAWRPDGGAAEQVEVAAAIRADDARMLAERMLARRESDRELLTLNVGPGGLALAPGDRVSVAGERGQWRVSGWTLERMRIALELRRIGVAPSLTASGADPGRALGAVDLAIGPTSLIAFEPPPLDDVPGSVPRVLALAGGSGAGWRGAVLSQGVVGGAMAAAGLAGVAAAIGTVAGVLAPASAVIVDRAGTVEAQLLRDDIMLADADAAAIDAGANLALIGDELVQFERAQPLGGGRWRLTGLWRGRRGTEWAMAGHSAGERFALIARDAAVAIDLSPASIGGTVRVEALGVGDLDGPAEVLVPVTGDSIVPPAPVGLRCAWPDGDTVAIAWTRRSRTGWSWRDGGDVPLGEEAERYVLSLADAAGWTRTVEADAPQAVVALDGPRAWPITVELRQCGAHGLSRPATGSIETPGGTLS